MRPPIEFLFPPEIGAELIYSFVIVVCSLMIYYATKEMYELSSYKGIKYFRQAFLFFAIAYFFRYSIRFLLLLFNMSDMPEISPMFVGSISLFIFLYSSSMAIFYLLYSVMWKRWSHSKLKIYLFNLLALVIALIGTFLRGIETNLALNMILLIFICFVLFIAYKDSKNKQKGKSLFIIYLILFIFWVLNVIDILIPRFLQIYRLVIYIVSILLFMIILYKVLKKTGD
ncbi:Uncharacterised protein [uncultured archaeon]|nr:Uncharacterised protein [uncultured archaeon]